MSLSKLSSWFESASDFVRKKAKEPNATRKAAAAAVALVGIYSLVKIVKYRRDKEKASSLNRYFSDTYVQARDRFVSELHVLKAKHKRIIIPQNNNICDELHTRDPKTGKVIDYSIDLGFFQGAKDSDTLIIHICGTHGVEGYAGSAIQLNLLKNYLPRYLSNDNSKRPHILFIHAMNAFGMSNHRRFNSFNVDLNRNCLFEYHLTDDDENEEEKKGNEENCHISFDFDKCVRNIKQVRNKHVFDAILATRDSSSYLMISNEIDRREMPTFTHSKFGFYLESLSMILKYGYPVLKKAIVEGQYVVENGLFFGGKEMQNEFVYLFDFLANNENKCLNEFGIDFVKNIKHLRLIDVHTGLGPFGIDTLLCRGDMHPKLVQLFPSYVKKNRILNETVGFYKQMYRNSIGGVGENFKKIFINADDSVTMSQEFGTYHTFNVFKALCEETRLFTNATNENYGNNKEFYDKTRYQCRNVFYPEHSIEWKKMVLQSGIHAFDTFLHDKEDFNKTWNEDTMTYDPK